eukprot:m.1565884 g.1565884  ORF g.1565884 m.1565884 type:complete len:123 (-) comp25288_c1_seq19:3169-3537(-)
MPTCSSKTISFSAIVKDATGGVGVGVVPNTTAAYEFYLWLLECPPDAGSTPMQLHFQWVDDSGHTFGDVSPVASLTCTHNAFDAAFVDFRGIDNPHTLAEREARDVVVTMRNTGTANWTTNE